MKRFLPFLDLRGYDRQQFPRDLSSALAVTFLCIPQGVAYAVIAGLPPAMGLYAGAVPAIIAAVMRSSRHVITGPTNAVSLIIGTAVVAGMDASPMTIGVTLALMVGLMQVSAGLLRLSALVDFISGAVVLGFITGAGILIGVGQLPNITATPGTSGHLLARLSGWVGDLSQADPTSVAVAVGTAVCILVLKRINRRIPAALLVLGGATGLSIALDLQGQGLRVIGDLASISASLPPLTLPDLSLVAGLVPLAVAITVLCMVESTSMARSIAHRTGQRLDISVEFVGEGLANIAGAFFGAYPATGSLSRSALNEREGAHSRLSGIISGLLVLFVPLALASVLDRVPISALAGLLVVVAIRLVDVAHIRRLMSSHNGDRLAFLGTLLATFALHLDQAIYVGVGISLINVIQRAKLLGVRDLVVDEDVRLREVSPHAAQRAAGRGAGDRTHSGPRYCRAVHILNVQGNLFFGATSELQKAIDEVLDDENISVMVLRLKRVHDLDISTLDVIEATAVRLRHEGRHLLLLGMRPKVMAYLQRTGTVTVVGEENCFPSRADHWFAALGNAVSTALARAGPHSCGDNCPYQQWLDEHGQELGG